jgi:hypothetical protein
MTTVGILAGTEFRLMVMPANSDYVKDLPPADPENPTMAERLFVHIRFPTKDGGVLTGSKQPSDWQHLDDATWATMGAGDAADLRAIIKKIYDQEKLDADL